MADDNNQPQNKKSRRAKSASAAKPVLNPNEKVSDSYDAQSYGIFKMRLTDQSSQIKRMTDYSEDSAIRLNDIYEILKTMRPVPYVSSLDTYFYENGYIPVKVINPCCDEESATDNIANKDKNKDKDKPKSFKEYLADIIPAVVPALAYIASKFHPAEEEVAAPADAMSIPVDPRLKNAKTGGMPAADAISTKSVPDPVKQPNAVVAEQPATSDKNSVPASPVMIINKPTPLGTITETSPKPIFPADTNPQVGAKPNVSSTPASRTPAFENLKGIAENPYRSLGRGGRGVPMNMPDLGMPGQGGVGGGKYPSIFGDEDSPILENMSYKKPDDALGNYGITKDNTDNTILTARKINFVAKEITYEAGKFEFIDQSSGASSGSSGSYGGSMGGDLSTVSFNPQESAIPMNGGGYNMSNKTVATGSLKENQAEAYKAAIESGLNDAAAKALVANMSGEALSKPGDVHADPSRSNPNQMAHGIVQWDNNRAEKIKQHFGKYPQDMTVAEQTKAAIWEIQSDYPGLWESMKTDDAASIVSKLVSQYERPADTQGATQQRLNYLSGLPDDLGVSKKTDSSNELSPHADIASKSASTTLELNKPPAAPTVAPAVSSASIINVKSSAPPVDEPWAAFHDMFDMLDDATLARNPWV